MILWLVGLSGSGKTTIGKLVYSQLKETQPNTVFVDGDEIRALFKHDDLKKDYSLEQRRKNAERIAEICLWLDRQDIHVVCCILCVFPDILEQNRSVFKDYKEVYLRTPLAVLMERDTKDVYPSSTNVNPENVVGVDIEFPEPRVPDLVLDTCGKDGGPEELAARTFLALGQ